jgi:phosphoribosylaminoimidazole carboxylase (NCAIR synthetase)
VDKIAPHPHNSGHYTTEAYRDETSQYENHLRVPPHTGMTTPKVPSAAMLTLLGSAEFAFGAPGAIVYLCGKRECRKCRDATHNDKREL